MLINRLLIGCGCHHFKLDRDRKLLNADVTSAYPVDLKSVEPVQKHVNKCEQRIIPDLNCIILLKLHHEWHTTISVWARRNLTRGRWFKMAQKLTPLRETIIHVSIESIIYLKNIFWVWTVPLRFKCSSHLCLWKTFPYDSPLCPMFHVWPVPRLNKEHSHWWMYAAHNLNTQISKHLSGSLLSDVGHPVLKTSSVSYVCSMFHLIISIPLVGFPLCHIIYPRCNQHPAERK